MQNSSGSTRNIYCNVTLDGAPVGYDTRAYLITGSGTTLPVTAMFDRPAGIYNVGVSCSANGLTAGNLWVNVTAFPR